MFQPLSRSLPTFSHVVFKTWEVVLVSHFTDEETEVWRDAVTYTDSRWQVALLESESSHLPPTPALSTTTLLTTTKCLEKH